MTEENQDLNENKTTVKLSRNQIIKLVILGALTFLAGFLAWFSLARVLNNGLSFNANNIWTFIFDLLFPVGVFCLWVAFVGLDAIFIHKRVWLYPIIFLSQIPVAVYFGFSWPVGLAFIILFLAFTYFANGVKKEQKDRIKFHVVNVIKIHLGTALLICVAAVSLLFYERLAAKQEGGEEPTNQMIANSTANFVNLFLAAQFKTYDPDMSLDEFMLVTGEQFIEKLGPQLGDDIDVKESYKTENIVAEINEAINKGEVERGSLPPEIIQKIDEGRLTAQDIIEAQATDLFSKQLTAARDDFLKQVGISAQGSDKISEVIKKIITAKLSEGLLPYLNWLPPLLAISLFFTLAIFVFLYVIFTKIFALLIYILMLATKFIVIKKETKEAEIAELS